MVKIFFSGVGGSGKTTLLNSLIKTGSFMNFKTIEEVARNIMKKKMITKEMLETDIKTYLLLQFEIIKKQSEEEERIQEFDFISDRSVIDCLAYIRTSDISESEYENTLQNYKVISKVSIVEIPPNLRWSRYPWRSRLHCTDPPLQCLLLFILGVQRAL